MLPFFRDTPFSKAFALQEIKITSGMELGWEFCELAVLSQNQVLAGVWLARFETALETHRLFQK